MTTYLPLPISQANIWHPQESQWYNRTAKEQAAYALGAVYGEGWTGASQGSNLKKDLNMADM